MPRIAILATALGFAIVQLDVSIVNVALAAISKDLHSGVAGLQWVVDAYTVAFASLLLSAGALGDRSGARRAFVAGFAIFGCGSLCCALAPNVAILIAARAVQGAGAALLVPCSLALLNHASGGDPIVRARAVSWWTAAGSLGLATGPIAGGLLIATVGWRSIFYVNVPFALAGIWLAKRFLEETPPRRSGLDLRGQALAIVALASLTGAVISAGKGGWTHPSVLGGVALAVLCGVLFLRVEALSPGPMLPLDFFKHVPFSAAVLVGVAINLTLYGALFVLSLYMQNSLGYSPLQTGMAFLPTGVAIGVANVFSGVLLARHGPWRPMMGGLVVGALGYFWLVMLHAHSSYASFLPGLLLFSFGIGTAVPAMTTAILADVEKSRSGIASGVLNTVRQSAGALGIALFGTLLSAYGLSGIRSSFVLSAILMLFACVPAAWGLGLGATMRRVLRSSSFPSQPRNTGFGPHGHLPQRRSPPR